MFDINKLSLKQREHLGITYFPFRNFFKNVYINKKKIPEYKLIQNYYNNLFKIN